MEFNEVIYKRRSIRKYLNKEVEEEKIIELLKYAMAAPSAMNKQPTLFYVIKNKDLLEKLSDGIHFSPIKSPIMIVTCVDLDKTITKRKDGFYIQDASIATQNMLLGAVNLGLSTCWIGTYPAEERVKKVQEILNLQTNIIPIVMIHVGYGDEQKEPRTQYDSNRVIYLK